MADYFTESLATVKRFLAQYDTIEEALANLDVLEEMISQEKPAL